MQALSQLSYTPTASPALYDTGATSRKPALAKTWCAVRRAMQISSGRVFDADHPAMSKPATPPLLANRVVLITGATGGLGAPIARACAAEGATVVLHARVVRKLEALYD
jgi:FlaA1/EpsC-like NDP-sugar epimerase